MEKALFATKLITQVATSDLEGVGTVRWKDGKCYRWVLNGESSVVPVGSLVAHKWTETSDVFKTVYQPLSANLAILAGVTVSILPASGYGWIQIFGYNASASIVKQASAGANSEVGDRMVAVNTVYHGIRLASAVEAGYARELVVAASVAKQTGAVASAVVTTAVHVRCL